MSSSTGFVDFFNKNKTFRPKKNFQAGTLRLSLYKQAQASLCSGLNLRQVVALPQGESLNDWVAVHVVDFFNRINLIYGIISDQCTVESCPTMSGGAKFEYLWADGATYRKPTRLPACKYIDLLIGWAEALINDETLFPLSIDNAFPKNFMRQCKKILTRLFRVFVHTYIHHFDHLVAKGAEAHVNTCFKHFYYFVNQFDLVKPCELEVLQDMIVRLCRDDSGVTPGHCPTLQEEAGEQQTPEPPYAQGFSTDAARSRRG